jgi:hypothetical protein
MMWLVEGGGGAGVECGGQVGAEVTGVEDEIDVGVGMM